MTGFDDIAPVVTIGDGASGCAADDAHWLDATDVKKFSEVACNRCRCTSNRYLTCLIRAVLLNHEPCCERINIGEASLGVRDVVGHWNAPRVGSQFDFLPVSSRTNREYSFSQSLNGTARPDAFDNADTFKPGDEGELGARTVRARNRDRKSTRLNSSHVSTSYAVFCL